MTDSEQLAAQIDVHLRTLRSANSESAAIAWMKAAYLLLERCSDDLRRPRVFSVPGHFGAPTFMLTPPRPLELPKHDPVKPLGFFDPRVQTVVYGNKYSNVRAWTRADTLRLERDNAKKRAASGG